MFDTTIDSITITIHIIPWLENSIIFRSRRGHR